MSIRLSNTAPPWSAGQPGPIILVLTFVILLASCSSDDSARPPIESLDAYISECTTFPDPPASNTGEHVLKAAHSDTALVPDEGHFICDVSEYRMDKNLHETTVFSVNDVSLWPGSIVRGGDIDKGVLNPVVAARAAVTVGTDLSGLSAEQGTRTVGNPTNLAVRGSLNEIVAAYLDGPGAGAIGAQLAFSETYVEDFSQSMLDLGISTSWWSWGQGSLQSDFSASHEEFTSSYLCRFSQVYFTASVEPPAAPSSYFASGVEPADLEAYMGEGDPPCYVSSVTYGRTGLLSIHSYARRDSVSMAVKAAFDGMGWDLDTEMDAAFVNILNSSEIKILVRGGDATDGVLPIIGDPIQGMRDWIENGASLANASDAVPISYTTRYLADNRMASFAYANEWTVEDCRPATAFFRVAVPQLHCVSADDGFLDNEIEVYYSLKLEYQPFEGADMITEVIESRPAGNSVDLRAGWDHMMPEAWRTVWMPEQKGARFRLTLWVSEDDAVSDNRIGYVETDWYGWPDWRGGGSCSYPPGFPEVGGAAATCSAHLQEDSGTDVIVYWEVDMPVPVKDW